MAQAQGNVVKTKYIVEITPGTTPAAALTILPVKTSNMVAQVNTTTSQEIRSDRATADLVRTSASSTGDIGFELSFTDYADFFESALGTASAAYASTASGNRTVMVNMSATTISAAAADNSLNDSANGFVTAGITANSWIVFRGFTGGNIANNNKPAKVVSVAAGKVVLSYITLVDDAAGETVTIKGQSITNAANKKTFSIEKEYTDLTTTFSSHKGMLVNTMTLNAAAEAIIEGTFGFMGRDSAYGAATIGTGPDVTPTATPIMSAVANVGTIYIDGTALSTTYLKSINLSTTNNVRALTAISNLYAFDNNLGSLGITAAISAFFNDSVQINKFLNGTSFSLVWSFQDSATNHILVEIPYAKFNSGTVSAASLNSDVMQDLSVTALLSPTENVMIRIAFLPA